MNPSLPLGSGVRKLDKDDKKRGVEDSKRVKEMHSETV